MKQTFADLGIPFPLFEAPVEEAYWYHGAGECSLCRSTHAHCFQLPQFYAIQLPCQGCGTENFVDVREAAGASCRSCSASLPLPYPADAEDVLACYPCARAGRAAMPKNTVLGLASWRSLLSGVMEGEPLEGEPGWERAGIERTPSPENPKVLRARVPMEHQQELLRTPVYDTWADEWWDFCCGRPMVYVGKWKAADFIVSAPATGSGRDFFNQTIHNPTDEIWENTYSADYGGPYMFRCAACQRLWGHWDSSHVE